MNIGIFSGSFNPIHIGHLILANYIVEFTEIDEIWFVVSPQNPLKKSQDLLEENVRFHMAQLALEGYPKMKASDFEFSLPRPSYTINTLDEFQKSYPQNHFYLIIGADNWEDFTKWKDHEKITDSFKIKIYPRSGYRLVIPSKLKYKVEALDSPIIDISSTFIREGLSESKSMKAFLPESVYEYIEKNNLYKSML